MKKIRFLVCFLVMFFLCSCDKVLAQELTCIYEGGLQSSATMLVQMEGGEFYVYTNSKNNKPGIDDSNWFLVNDYALEVNYEWDTGYYDEDNEILTNCPSYTRQKTKTNNEGIIYTFYFYGKKTWNHLDYSLLSPPSPYYGVPEISDFKQNFTEDDNYSDEITNTEWIGICNYEDVILYFNREKMILDNKSSLIYSTTSGFSLNQLLEYYDETGTCPTSLYQKVDQTVVSIGNTFSYVTYYLNDVGSAYKEVFIAEGSYIRKEEEIPSDEKIDDCLDLFSEEFIEKINYCLKLVRILVPILLVGLGVLDFGKAIFSSSEDEMKKAQTKFMKRLIAAVIVFLIPIVINFLLQLANGVWSFIDPNSCGIG